MSGDLIKADVFAEGESIDVTSTSKGKANRRRYQALELPDLKNPTVPARFTVTQIPGRLLSPPRI